MLLLVQVGPWISFFLFYLSSWSSLTLPKKKISNQSGSCWQQQQQQRIVNEMTNDIKFKDKFKDQNIMIICSSPESLEKKNEFGLLFFSLSLSNFSCHSNIYDVQILFFHRLFVIGTYYYHHHHHLNYSTVFFHIKIVSMYEIFWELMNRMKSLAYWIVCVLDWIKWLESKNPYK